MAADTSQKTSRSDKSDRSDDSARLELEEEKRKIKEVRKKENSILIFVIC